MKKNKTLWNGVSVLIVIELVIMAFTRDHVQLGLMTVAVIAWSAWAIFRFLVPYVAEKLDARETREIREFYEAEEKKAFFAYGRRNGDRTPSTRKSPHYCASAIGISRRNLGMACR